MDEPKLSIIIPAYNEEKRIGKTLRAYSEFFKNTPHEIIVVLNGCVDNTESIVKNYKKEYPHINYITTNKKGKGNAVLEGIKLSKGDLISFVDADNATKPDQVDFLIKNMGSHGAIMGSRWMKGSKILTKQPIIRQFMSRGFNLLVRLTLNLNFSDTQCGGKVFKKEAINSILHNLKTTGWAMDVAMLYNIKKEGYKIKEVPIEWEEPGGTVLKMRKAIPEMFLTLLKLRFNK
ncbi:MAG: glycosyltransferase family 2 protein [Nanoarchaeota archaeon]|nr:glycosyltransferase family 2 protein [Nanoarchaeota archaeon]